MSPRKALAALAALAARVARVVSVAPVARMQRQRNPGTPGAANSLEETSDPHQYVPSFDDRRAERIAEMLEPLTPDDAYDTCAHGVSFDEWCDECIAEMHDALG